MERSEIRDSLNTSTLIPDYAALHPDYELHERREAERWQTHYRNEAA
jgi:hypothetical protein